MIRYIKVSFRSNRKNVCVTLAYSDVRHLIDNSYAPEKGRDCVAVMAFHQVCDQVRGRTNSHLWDLAFDVADSLETVMKLSYGASDIAPSDQLAAYLGGETVILGARAKKHFLISLRSYRDLLE